MKMIRSIRALKYLIGYHITRDRIPFVVGFPGISKSSAAAQWASENGYAIFVYRFGMMAQNEVGGIAVPMFDDRTVERFMPELIAAVTKLHLETGLPVLIVLDEMDKANKAIQNTALEVTLDRAIANFMLPEGTRLMMAGNVGNDGSGAHSISTALGNRVVTLPFAGPTATEWTRWLRRVAPEIGAMVHSTPAILWPSDKVSGFDPRASVNTTPRSLADASDMLLHPPVGVTDTEADEFLELSLGGVLNVAHVDRIMTMRALGSKLYSFQDILDYKIEAFDEDDEDRLVLANMQWIDATNQLHRAVKDASSATEAHKTIVAVVDYVTDMCPAECNAAALDNAIGAVDDGTGNGMLRVSQAFERTKSNPKRYEKLRDRVQKALAS